MTSTRSASLVRLLGEVHVELRRTDVAQQQQGGHPLDVHGGAEQLQGGGGMLGGVVDPPSSRYARPRSVADDPEVEAGPGE